jgi:hypothetical protein
LARVSRCLSHVDRTAKLFLLRPLYQGRKPVENGEDLFLTIFGLLAGVLSVTFGVDVIVKSLRAGRSARGRAGDLLDEIRGTS